MSQESLAKAMEPPAIVGELEEEMVHHPSVRVEALCYQIAREVTHRRFPLHQIELEPDDVRKQADVFP